MTRDQYFKEFYRKQDEQAVTLRRYAFNRKERVFSAMWRYKEDRGCHDCGERDTRLLEFDHRQPERKSFTIPPEQTKGPVGRNCCPRSRSVT